MTSLNEFNQTGSLESSILENERFITLDVVQPPVQARMCGFGEKDRRPIDPPPVVKLTVRDSLGNHDHSFMSYHWFVIHTTLLTVMTTPYKFDHTTHYFRLTSYSPGSFTAHTAVLSDSEPTDVQPAPATPPRRRSERNAAMSTLIGTVVATPSLLRDTVGTLGLFFVFPDLGVRSEGVYQLKFSLLMIGDSLFSDLAATAPSPVDTPNRQTSLANNSFSLGDNVRAESLTMDKGVVIASVISPPFKVYTARNFPGMSVSTDLSMCFNEQGIKLPIRTQPRIARPSRVAGPATAAESVSLSVSPISAVVEIKYQDQDPGENDQ
ncbi:hypothetical protein HK096_007189, partial [Nowakowskiella sp. JEL0078]